MLVFYRMLVSKKKPNLFILNYIMHILSSLVSVGNLLFVFSAAGYMAGKMVGYANFEMCGSIACIYSVSPQAFTSAKVCSNKLSSSPPVVTFL